MLLLDVVSMNTTIAATLMTAVIGSFTFVITYWIKSSDGDKRRTNEHIIKKLDEITSNQIQFEQEIRPLGIQLAEHAIEIKNIKEKVAETNRWVGLHDQQIQEIHRAVKRT